MDNQIKIPIKIAITGKMGSGKSTLAKIFCEMIDGHITSFSSQIRKVLAIVDVSISRKNLQETGDFFRSFNDVVWVDMLLKEVKQIQNSIIIDGIRYPIEAVNLVKNGFKIIKIESLEPLRRARIANRDRISISDEVWDEWNSHPTEKFLHQISFDYTIDNKNTIEQFKTDASEILKAIKNNL